MGIINNSKERFTELLFENRNRSYGAYIIRKTYDKRVVVSALVTISLLVMAMVTPAFFGNKEKEVVTANNDKKVKIIDVKIAEKKPDPVQPKQPKVSPVTPPKGNVSNVIRPVDSTKLTDADTTKHDQFVFGDPHGKDTLNHDPLPPGGGGHDSIPVVPTLPTEPVAWADTNPEFPGGLKALYEFLRKNIRYPATALENKIGGTVRLSFVVDADGTVKNIASMNNPDPSLVKEAIRVAGLMPKWKPGKMGTHPVAVKFGIPVKFTTGER